MALLSSLALGCSPYEYHDGAALATARAKFGAPYTLHARPEPAMFSGQLYFSVSYRGCSSGNASTFTVLRDEDDASHRLGGVLVIVRSEPDECRGEAQERWERVSAELPAETTNRFLAFPPGSDFELWSLDAQPSAVVSRPLPSQPAPPAAWPPPATPCPPAALRLYVHRAVPKRANPNGPCSTLLEVLPNASLAEVRALASERLGAPIGALLNGDGAAAVLHDGALLVALEEEGRSAGRELPVEESLFSMAEATFENARGPSCSAAAWTGCRADDAAESRGFAM
jgi:hypothetical protein